MRQYFLHVDEKKANHAGSKAVQDCETILNKLGFKKIKAYSCFSKIRVIRKIIKGLQLAKMYLIPKGAIVVIQHPYYMDNRYLNDLEKLKKKKNLYYIFIIHDLESIRNLFENKDIYQEKDWKMFSIADIVIAHNEKMIKKIQTVFGYPIDRMVSLQIFDYLLGKETNIELNKKGKSYGVMVVGNLNRSKSGYLYNDNFKNVSKKFALYGPQFDQESLKDARYYGQFPPEKVVEQLQGSFGLVWDGNSPDCCEGKIGKYLMINNPHKTSMYLASGFPVIIWKEAALAEFVEKNHVGVTVDSLWEIPDILNKISEEEYENMLNNVAKVSKKITKGYFLRKALNQAMNKLN